MNRDIDNMHGLNPATDTITFGGYTFVDCWNHKKLSKVYIVYNPVTRKKRRVKF